MIITSILGRHNTLATITTYYNTRIFLPIRSKSRAQILYTLRNQFIINMFIINRPSSPFKNSHIYAIHSQFLCHDTSTGSSSNHNCSFLYFTHIYSVQLTMGNPISSYDNSHNPCFLHAEVIHNTHPSYSVQPYHRIFSAEYLSHTFRDVHYVPFSVVRHIALPTTNPQKFSGTSPYYIFPELECHS